MLFDIWILFVDSVGTQIMRENFKFDKYFNLFLFVFQTTQIYSKEP